VLTSEGERQAAINVAEGERQSKILQSEAVKIEQINEAQGEASATIARAEARARAIRAVAEAIGVEDGNRAASLSVAEQYVAAFSNLAKNTNTLLLPSDTGDISAMVSQAMAIYGQLTKSPLGTLPPTPSPTSPQESENKQKKDTLPEKPHQGTDSATSFEGGVKGTSLAAAATSMKAPFANRSRTVEAMPFSVATSPTRQRDFFDID
jgi:hypothetical protein